MSLLTAFATEAAPLLLSDWGEAVSYLPADGSAARAISAVVTPTTAGLEDVPNGKNWLAHAQISVYQNSVTGIANPREKDGIEQASGVVWEVQGWSDGNGGMWLLECGRRDVVEKGIES